MLADIIASCLMVKTFAATCTSKGQLGGTFIVPLVFAQVLEGDRCLLPHCQIQLGLHRCPQQVHNVLWSMLTLHTAESGGEHEHPLCDPILCNALCCRGSNTSAALHTTFQSAALLLCSWLSGS